MAYSISLITGDGIGPEISEAASILLDVACGPLVSLTPLRAGDAALAETGHPLPQDTLDAVRSSDACLKAPVGESAADVIVRLRLIMDLYANIRPAKSYPGLPSLRDDIDMVIVRENTEDLYTGAEFELDDMAVALRVISKRNSERIARYAFETARRRGGKMLVTCVHKANVMRVTDGLFSRECARVAAGYPDVRLEQMYVDACAMNLIRRPERFDVIVTTNLFGDILSDESSQAAGGLGMAPCANIGAHSALFEPVHGAAFDIAGRGIANPASMMLTSAMMLDWLASRHGDRRCADAASRIERAVAETISAGIKTADVGGSTTTMGFTGEVASRV